VIVCRRQGALTPLSRVLTHLGEVEWSAGDWTRAYATRAEAARLTGRGSGGWQWNTVWNFAYSAALLGRDEDVRDGLAQLSGWPGIDDGQRVADLAAIDGVRALATGRGDDAARRYADVVALTLAVGVEHPIWRTAVDAVEAFVRAGRVDDARAVRDSLSGVPAAWADALLAADDDVDGRFGDALRAFDAWAGPWFPYHRARLQLAWGGRLRRAGRRVDARAHVREALAAFERLGAAPWAERARDELRASGERLRRGPSADLAALTPQELQVALVIASGTSYKDAAARLFLSPKTIEFHMNKVYRKLGIASRLELAGRLSEIEARVGG
jgi:DNA-binding CsgD family transcriptional regulator